jgi:hypothetical protein
VTPIREVDDVPVGCGVRGPVTKEIQRAFYEATSGWQPQIQVMAAACQCRAVRAACGQQAGSLGEWSKGLGPWN